jgi:hypothetical protein
MVLTLIAATTPTTVSNATRPRLMRTILTWVRWRSDLRLLLEVLPVTPSGLEKGRNITGSRSVTVSPREPGAVERPAVTFECNECNEALDGTREVIRDARRLAMVAMNALLNGDPQCARRMLDQLQSVLASQDGQAEPASVSPARPR